MSINLRIKELREYVNLSKKDFSSIIKVDASQYGKIESGVLKPTLTQLMEISSIYGKSLDWLCLGKGSFEMKTSISNQTGDIDMKYSLITDVNIENQKVPLYDIEAMASIVPLFNDTEDIQPIDHISIPNLPKCDGAVHISGDSMYPLLKSGDIVMYKEVTDIKNDVFWGQMYLLSIAVNGDDFVMVKYLQKSEKGDDWVKLVSQNKHHQDKDIHIDKIQALALIKASIRINTMN